MPWFIRNYISFNFSFSGTIGTGYYSFFQPTEEIITTSGIEYKIFIDFFLQIIIHHGFIILASGVIFFTFALIFFYKSLFSKDIDLIIFGLIIFIIMEFLILLTAYHNLSCTIIWRLNGRYIEAVLPLIIILGFVALNKLNLNIKLTKIFLIITWPILLIAPTIWESYGNRMSISYLVLFKEKYISIIPVIGDLLSDNIILLKFIFLLTILIILIVLLVKSTRKMLIIFSIFIILFATICPTIIIINTRSQSKITNEYEIGLWINEHTKNSDEILIFDSTMDQELIRGLMGKKIRQRFASWSTSKILLKEIHEKLIKQNNFSYVISFQDLTSYNLDKIYNATILLPVGWINPKTAEGKKSIFIYSSKDEMVEKV